MLYKEVREIDVFSIYLACLILYKKKNKTIKKKFSNKS